MAVEECSVSCAVNLHACPIDGAVGSRVNQQRCPTFRSARFLQMRIASGVTLECVAGVVGFVLYSGRFVSKILRGLFTLVRITKLWQWCSARCHKCKNVQSDAAVLRRYGTLSYFLMIVKTFKVLRISHQIRVLDNIVQFSCSDLSQTEICIHLHCSFITQQYPVLELRHPSSSCSSQLLEFRVRIILLTISFLGLVVTFVLLQKSC